MVQLDQRHFKFSLPKPDMARLPITQVLRTRPGVLSLRRSYASARPQLISPTTEIDLPPERTAYEFKALDEPDPQLDGLQYPRVVSISRQWRNPYAKWDDPQERINFNEPLHAEEEMMGMWAPDVHRISVSTALANLAVAFSGVGAILAAAYYMAPASPVVPRTFLHDGLPKEIAPPGQEASPSLLDDDSE